MSNVHPFEGEKMGHGDTLRFWDDYADMYSSMQQGDIPQRVVRILSDEGYLAEDSTVLELGSGPGTYSLLGSVCQGVDVHGTSPRMLDRLMASASERGIGNITPLLQDWGTYRTYVPFTTCMASLCPGTGTSESILRMESVSSHGCVIVSWLENHGDDLTAQVWQALGKDYGFGFRPRIPHWTARENGSRSRFEVRRPRIVADIRVDDSWRKIVSAFRAYGVGVDVEPIVRSIWNLRSMVTVIHYDRVNRMKLIAGIRRDQIPIGAVRQEPFPASFSRSIGHTHNGRFHIKQGLQRTLTAELPA